MPLPQPLTNEQHAALNGPRAVFLGARKVWKNWSLAFSIESDGAVVRLLVSGHDAAALARALGCVLVLPNGETAAPAAAVYPLSRKPSLLARLGRWLASNRDSANVFDEAARSISEAAPGSTVVLPLGLRLSRLPSQNEPDDGISEQRKADHIEKKAERLGVSGTAGDDAAIETVLDHGGAERMVDELPHAEQQQADSADQRNVVADSDGRNGKHGAGCDDRLVPLVQQLDVVESRQSSPQSKHPRRRS